MPLDDMNPRVRLSVQRALLGEITAEMRVITADWTDSLILIRVYHDGPLDPRIPEEMDAALTEVYADFAHEGFDVEAELVRVDAPEKVEPEGWYVHERKEVYYCDQDTA